MLRIRLHHPLHHPTHRFQDKVFPLLLHHNVPDIFSYRYCNFKVQKSKSGTGRVVGFRELGLVNRWVHHMCVCGCVCTLLASWDCQLNVVYRNTRTLLFKWC